MQLKRFYLTFCLSVCISLGLSMEGCERGPAHFNPRGAEMNSSVDRSSREQDDIEQTASSWGSDPELVRQLTRNMRTFPSSQRVNDHINRKLSPPQTECLSTDVGPRRTPSSVSPTSKELSPAAVGARKTLATIFQSCKAVDTVIGPRTQNLRGIQRARSFGPYRGVAGGLLRRVSDRDQLVSSHVVLSQLASDPNYPGPQCRDMTQTPPVYGFGSRFGPNRGGEINLFQRGGGVSPTSEPAVSIDCSSFISVALTNAGLKVDPGGRNYSDMTTLSFHQKARDPNSCLDRPKMSASQSLQSGDMVNVSQNHIIMIDEVGEDPLAINRFAESGNCQDIRQSDFDFTYIHSGAYRNGYGPSRVHSSVRSASMMFENLRLVAVRTCLAKLRGNSDDISQDEMNLNPRFDIIRHNSDNPACVSSSRSVLRGEECIQSCENLGK